MLVSSLAHKLHILQRGILYFDMIKEVVKFWAHNLKGAANIDMGIVCSVIDEWFSNLQACAKE